MNLKIRYLMYYIYIFLRKLYIAYMYHLSQYMCVYIVGIGERKEKKENQETERNEKEESKRGELY